MPAIEPTWTEERLTLLQSHFEAGLSCRQIAVEIGVSRNAVIGKLSRLNLTRRTSREPGRPARKARARLRGVNASPRAQYEMLAALYAEPAAPIEDTPIDERLHCSLLELAANRCRWPISTPGADDFCFCGNPPLDGLPYCPGHSRLAYRPNSRPRVAGA